MCSWEERDDPWVEHASWPPRCPFLLVSKGSEFVDEVRKVFKMHKRKVDADCVNSTDEVALQCLIRLTNEKSLVFLPCKHCCVCSSCGPRMKACVVCRKPAESTMSIYLSRVFKKVLLIAFYFSLIMETVTGVIIWVL